MNIFEQAANNNLSPEEFEAAVWEAQRHLSGGLVGAAQRWKPDHAQSNFSYFTEGLTNQGFPPAVAVAAVSDAAKRAGHNWPVEVD